MKRKKRIIILALCIIFALFCLYRIYSMDKVKVLRSDSSFDDFYVEEDKVYIKCHIAIQNSNDVDEYISLAADMEEDAANGLLKSPTVFGYDKAGKRGFLIPANSIKEYECVFIGDFAGTAQKHDRNLPEMDILQIESDVDAYAEYENVIYYTPHSGSALYKYTPEDDRKECLLKEGVGWFTIYKGNILIVWGDNIKTYDLQTGTIQTLVEPLHLGWPFCAERIGDYIILCDNNVRLFSIKQKEVVQLLERQALSFDEIEVCDKKAYIKMQQYTLINKGESVLRDASWNGTWCLDIERYEESGGTEGFEQLTQE